MRHPTRFVRFTGATRCSQWLTSFPYGPPRRVGDAPRAARGPLGRALPGAAGPARDPPSLERGLEVLGGELGVGRRGGQHPDARGGEVHRRRPPVGEGRRGGRARPSRRRRSRSAGRRRTGSWGPRVHVPAVVARGGHEQHARRGGDRGALGAGGGRAAEAGVDHAGPHPLGVAECRDHVGDRRGPARRVDPQGHDPRERAPPPPRRSRRRRGRR